MAIHFRGNYYPFPDEHKGICRGDGEPSFEDFACFLEMLRESRKVNMMGAVPYIMHYMDVDSKTASKAFKDWINHPNKVKQLEQLIQGNTK